MFNRPVEILLVEPDLELATMIQGCLRAAMRVNVTIAPTAAAGLSEELTATHDILLVATELPDAEWPEFVGEIRRTNRGPIILLAGELSTDELIDGMRAGVMDVLCKPFDLGRLTELVNRAAHRAFQRSKRQLRNRRLRKVTSRVIRERRDLRQRMDLLCRDFVHAYRRLAQRVSEADLVGQTCREPAQTGQRANADHEFH